MVYDMKSSSSPVSSPTTPTSPSSKKSLKEKIAGIYDGFLEGGDPSFGNPNFWHELFLLKVNATYLEDSIDEMKLEELLAVKDNINLLFAQCCIALHGGHKIKVVNSLQTLCALVQAVFRKKLGDHGFDAINILIGFDAAEAQMQGLLESLHTFIVGDYPVSLKNLALKLALILVTATDNVSQNTIIEYIMINSVFEAITQILADPVARQQHGYEAMLLLTILVNYRKYEASNPYIVKLSILDDELALNGLGCVISAALTNYNRKHHTRLEKAGGGFINSIASFVGSMFVAENENVECISTNEAVLLALYEALHLNRNFFTVLSHVTDQYANAFLHDSNMMFSVPLHRVHMYHRKPVIENAPSKPLACALLDLMVEFIITHMMKKLPAELYSKALGVIHRMLCYQKRCRVRLSYTWKDLWSSLMNLLKFILSNETHLVKICNIFSLASQVVNIFNLFITYGDTFLPCPTSYDELYYEVIRVHQIFDNLYSMALRHSTNGGEWKDAASKLSGSLLSITLPP
ncbi:UPF0668 protein C10orf76-like [Exaiptasia diaphana]|nr:UPF0668 protein C10orf76-like [Exaiptasia diaphana]